MKNLFKLFLVLIVWYGQIIFAKQYEVPPSSTTRNSVPVISDEAMEACVKLYNEIKWLGQELDTIQVDRYSEVSVNNYNAKVNKQQQMQNYFNQNCAGKQSESAKKAADNLNKKGY